jgi:hypothetical protein
MSEYKINRDSIKHLLETPPCVGVDITETPMTFVEKAAKTFVERKHEYIMECIVKADIDPDALIKTAKKNQELMTALGELYEKTKWISVKDRLPEKYVGVLVYNGSIHEDFICSSGYFYDTLDVTHWMPLPEPPKESEGNQ